MVAPWAGSTSTDRVVFPAERCQALGLESGCYWPASDLAGCAGYAEQTQAARSGEGGRRPSKEFDLIYAACSLGASFGTPSELGSISRNMLERRKRISQIMLKKCMRPSTTTTRPTLVLRNSIASTVSCGRGPSRRARLTK